ncbi:MAG TPA: ribonuclease R [Candidatus Paceibacterota bacterium]|nr:ribonuclease R [Candidatus Paceibacterota bacterium]
MVSSSYKMSKKKPKNKNENEKVRLQGTISINSRGVGYVANPADPKAEDLEIENAFLNTALNGDLVVAVPHPKKKGRRLQGEVVEILQRAKTQFVGVLEAVGSNFFLVPDDRKMYIDIFISKERALNAKAGEKVLTEIVSWKDRKKSPEGRVLKVLGQKGDHNVEMESIVLEKGFDTTFPESAILEAERIEREEKEIAAAEISSRRDFRSPRSASGEAGSIFTCTIDPVDAKDFDDALSFQKLPNGNYEVGVHIADVSYYVRPNSELDKEARKRGFSVYLVDRTIPMLPHALSNDICSLNPQEDKLTFSAVFEITPNAEVKNRWFGRTIIHSDKRFAYEEAQEILNKKSGEYFNELNTLNELSKIFRKKKTTMGAIDFETDEVKFKLDERGKPIEVVKKSRLDTHKLIEEFMLLANREVAHFIYQSAREKYQNKDISIYRIHDVPDKEKIAELSIFLKALGYELPIHDKKISPKDIQALLNQVEGKAEESLIKTATIRSMAKAIYSTKNIGHFGLAFDYYTHFTSPIRRYPDLLVHRILNDILHGKKISPDQMAYYYKVSEESTRREIAAADAERSSIKYKQVEYMSEHVGEIYDGIISGVTDWGIYVEEVTTKSEGMVRLRDLTDDYYIFDQKNYAIVGEKTKKKYTLGDKVKIKVKAADLEKKTLDYQFVNF